jgi:putative tryptophan/tyrosine transport system substrate-binding protein
MKRREFITLLGGATAWPLAARAQQPQPSRRIGMLLNQAAGDQDTRAWIGAFRQQLEALGWSEPRNLRIDIRFAAGELDRVRDYAADLVNSRADVLFAESTPMIAALQQATRTMPIVFVGGSNPVGSGFVLSLAHPGGNITGFISFEPAMGGKWLETLREIAPHVRRAALIYNPQTHTGQYFASIEIATRSLAIEIVRAEFREAADIERNVEDFARQPNGGLLVLSDPSTTLHRELIVALAARHGLPAIYPFRYFVTGGGLASYGVDRLDQYRRAGGYVARIFKGESPADLPVQTPVKFELAINLKTARALGLDVPPTLIARADEVIE